MNTSDDGSGPIDGRFVLGLLVLGLTCLLSNFPSVPVDLPEFGTRLASDLIRQLFGIGYWAQLLTGVWLALSLRLDERRGVRMARVAWLLSLCLFLTPVPTLKEVPDLAPLLLSGVALLGVLAREIDAATTEPVA